MSLPKAYVQLVQALDQLPTVGPLAAERFAQHLLNTEQGAHLQRALNQALAELKRCEHCQAYSQENCCELCADTERHQHGVLVVASVAQQQQALAAGFAGQIFILHGLLSPLAGIGPKQLRLDKLKTLLTHTKAQSIILALEDSAEGRATRQFIQEFTELSSKEVQALSWENWLAKQLL